MCEIGVVFYVWRICATLIFLCNPFIRETGRDDAPNYVFIPYGTEVEQIMQDINHVIELWEVFATHTKFHRVPWMHMCSIVQPY